MTDIGSLMILVRGERNARYAYRGRARGIAGEAD